jgi:hypothetical protein
MHTIRINWRSTRGPDWGTARWQSCKPEALLDFSVRKLNTRVHTCEAPPWSLKPRSPSISDWSPQLEYTQSLTPVSPITPTQSISTYNPITAHFIASVHIPGWRPHPAKIKSYMLCHHFLADLEKSSGIMEQTISSFISKCQMAAQLCRYLIIAKKHCQPVYAHLSGIRAYTYSQCMRTRTDRVKQYRASHNR